MKTFKYELWQSAKILSIALVLSMGVQYATAAWTGPTATAPGGNVSAPINVSATSQVKSGGLGVTNFLADSVTVGATTNTSAITSPKFCIGTSCVTAWSGPSSVVTLSAIRTLTSGNNATYNTPLGISYIVVEVWGGGGGANGGSNGGAGGGGYSMKLITNPATSYTYTIGIGGAVGAGGGASCFGTNTNACTAPILSASGGSTGVGTPGGAGGTGSGGDINLNGQSGGSNSTSGAGGSAPRGGGGGSGGGQGGASPGIPFGGGGGGAGSAGSGAPGAPGAVVIYEYTTLTP